MNTRNFRCFQIVYEERNLQSAANKLFLSPQGVSKIIKSLEDEVGTPLFIRSKEGFVPTEGGKIFYEKSKTITKDLRDLFSAIEKSNGAEKRFKVGFAAGTIRAIDSKCVNEYMNSHPEIMATWREYDNKNVIKQVLNDELNFGFVIGKPSENGVVCKLIKSFNIVLYVNNKHRFWYKEQVSISDIQNESLITMDENYHIFHDVLNACIINGFNPNIVATVKEGEAIYQLAKNGIGIGISPQLFKDNENIRAVAIKDAPTWGIYGIYRKNTLDVELAENLLKALE